MKYKNEYVTKKDHVQMYIYGLKHEAIIILDKADYERVSKVHWGVMAVGKEGNKKIIPYTTTNRVSVPLGRWLLNVRDSDKRVEHKDRNNHNFSRENIYIVGNRDVKQQESKNEKGLICGVFEIKHKSGNVTGYKVQFHNPDKGKKDWICFNARAYQGLDKAKDEAIRFKLSLIKTNLNEIA